MRPLSETLGFLERAGFEIRDVQALREHYVRTVQDWLATFEDRYADAVAMVGEEVARVWRLYLVGGGLSFEEGRMGVDQILAVRPSEAGASAMPPTPDWIDPVTVCVGDRRVSPVTGSPAACCRLAGAHPGWCWC